MNVQAAWLRHQWIANRESSLHSDDFLSFVIKKGLMTLGQIWLNKNLLILLMFP